MSPGIRVVHAFCGPATAGTPLGLVVDADQLHPPERRQLARRIDLPVTVFVSSSRIAHFRVEFFSPVRQIAHDDQAAIAALSYLRQMGRVSYGGVSLETFDGVRQFLVQGDMAFVQQTAPRYWSPREAAAPATTVEMLAALGLPESASPVGQEPVIASTGSRFLLLALRDAATVASAQPMFADIARLSRQLDLVGFYIYARSHGPCAAFARMFAPCAGIAEGFATVAAAGALGCLLHQRHGVQAPHIVVSQAGLPGQSRACRLVIELDLHGTSIERLFTGGSARPGAILEHAHDLFRPA